MKGRCTFIVYFFEWREDAGSVRKVETSCMISKTNNQHCHLDSGGTPLIVSSSHFTKRHVFVSPLPGLCPPPPPIARPRGTPHQTRLLNEKRSSAPGLSSCLLSRSDPQPLRRGRRRASSSASFGSNFGAATAAIDAAAAAAAAEEQSSSNRLMATTRAVAAAACALSDTTLHRSSSRRRRCLCYGRGRVGAVSGNTLPNKTTASQVSMFRQLLHTHCRPGFRLSRKMRVRRRRGWSYTCW